MSKPNHLIATCCSDCTERDILQATDSPELADRIADWFEEHEATEVKPQAVHC